MKNIPWWRISFGAEEIQRISESITRENISQGPVVAEFEQRVADYLGIPYVIATTSGTSALIMAMIAAGLKPGDEVIVPNRTWIATAHAPHLLGAKVVLVDVEETRPIIDVQMIESKITSRTKAIIPVHLNGRSACMREINRIAEEHGICVVEDAAQAIGSRNANGFLGTQSHMGCFSLSMTKLISTGQGGFITTRHKDIAEKLCAIRTHGVENVLRAFWVQPGGNFRFNDILASIGLVQMDRLVERIAHVRSIYSRYEEGLRGCHGMDMIPVDLVAGEVPVYVEIFCEDRSALVDFLRQRNIDTRPFYPDLDKAPYFASDGFFPRSRKYGSHGLYLPCGPNQSIENIDLVVEHLRDFSASSGVKRYFPQPS